MEGISNHKDLIAWKAAITLAARVYGATAGPPSPGDLVQEVRRIAIHIPSQIAEAAACRNRPECMRLLRLARGSLAALETYLMVARENQLIGASADLLSEMGSVSGSLNRLLRWLAERRAPTNDVVAGVAGRQLNSCPTPLKPSATR